MLEMVEEDATLPSLEFEMVIGRNAFVFSELHH